MTNSITGVTTQAVSVPRWPFLSWFMLLEMVLNRYSNKSLLIRDHISSVMNLGPLAPYDTVIS